MLPPTPQSTLRAGPQEPVQYHIHMENIVTLLWFPQSVGGVGAEKEVEAGKELLVVRSGKNRASAPPAQMVLLRWADPNT